MLEWLQTVLLAVLVLIAWQVRSYTKSTRDEINLLRRGESPEETDDQEGEPL